MTWFQIQIITFVLCQPGPLNPHSIVWLVGGGGGGGSFTVFTKNRNFLRDCLYFITKIYICWIKWQILAYLHTFLKEDLGSLSEDVLRSTLIRKEIHDDIRITENTDMNMHNCTCDVTIMNIDVFCKHILIGFHHVSHVIKLERR